MKQTPNLLNHIEHSSVHSFAEFAGEFEQATNDLNFAQAKYTLMEFFDI